VRKELLFGQPREDIGCRYDGGGIWIAAICTTALSTLKSSTYKR
jgi:hypothetical protein